MEKTRQKPQQPDDSKYSCCNWNKSAKIQNIHHNASWNDLKQKEKIIFLLQHSTECNNIVFMDIFEKYCFHVNL